MPVITPPSSLPLSTTTKIVNKELRASGEGKGMEPPPSPFSLHCAKLTQTVVLQCERVVPLSFSMHFHHPVQLLLANKPLLSPSPFLVLCQQNNSTKLFQCVFLNWSSPFFSFCSVDPPR